MSLAPKGNLKKKCYALLFHKNILLVWRFLVLVFVYTGDLELLNTKYLDMLTFSLNISELLNWITESVEQAQKTNSNLCLEQFLLYVIFKIVALIEF